MKKKEEKSELSEKYINIGVYLGLMLLRRVADIAGRIAAGPIFFMQETNLRSEVMSEPGEKRKMKMVAHVNGWSAIERQLRLQAKKQGELARVLEISQAAVSLMKKGSFLHQRHCRL